jgi:aryl-alcohol dehydrogenase-like predicted oxidoreductase
VTQTEAGDAIASGSVSISADVILSRIILGAGGFDRPDIRLSERIWDHYLEQGGTTFDTANFYHSGNHEVLLGRWLMSRRVRQRIVLITKAGHPINGVDRVNPAVIQTELAESLKRLGTDYVDLFLLHRDDPTAEVGPIIDCLESLRESGAIREYGASNWTMSRLDDAADYARENGFRGFACSSPYLGLARHRTARWPGGVSACDAASLRWYRARQMPLLAWSARSEGWFAEPGPGPAAPAEVYDDALNRARRIRAIALAREMGLTPSQIALAWVLSQPFPVAALVGASSEKSVDESLTVSSERLDPGDRRGLFDGGPRTRPVPEAMTHPRQLSR